MAGRGRRHYNNQGPSRCNAAKDVAASFAANSPVYEMFKLAAVTLNKRQDRHERLVKLSRDITIESKRIIFQLHSAIVIEDQRKAVTDGLARLQKLMNGPIREIGLELENCPAYLHSRAISPGFQEFVEARTLCHLLQQRVVIPWKDVQEEFSYKEKSNHDGDTERALVTMLPPVDYMLGLADLTGELMRRTINCISSGDVDESFFTCKVVRDLYTGFLGLSGGGRELYRKLGTTRMNTLKAENAVYAVRVRGGEVAKVRGGEGTRGLLLPVDPDWDVPTLHDDLDEGFY